MSSLTFSSFRCCHSSPGPASPPHPPLSILQTKPNKYESRDKFSLEASSSNVTMQQMQLSKVALVTPSCRNFLKHPVSFQSTSLLSLVSSCWRFVAPSHFQKYSIHQMFSILVAVTLASNLQGAPSSMDTFENVPQTLSGNFFCRGMIFWDYFHILPRSYWQGLTHSIVENCNFSRTELYSRLAYIFLCSRKSP